MIEAAGINEYRSSDPKSIRGSFARAVAFTPDSTAEPILGRLPYTADGVFIDSIWQMWLQHDPYTMIPSYKDSLLKLKAIQMYIGAFDDLQLSSNESFHQALDDNGIEHGYKVYNIGHEVQPLLNDLLVFFSEHLTGVVPTVSLTSDYYLENTDSLLAEANTDGILYVVPFSSSTQIDSIYKYQLATVDALANELYDFQLSELEYGKYQVYAISSDGAVCNIPGEFCIVPDTSSPILSPENSRVIHGDSIRVSMSKDGKLCLVDPGFFFLDTLWTASEIMNSSKLIGSVDALAGSEISFTTDDLSTKTYWIYGLDQYGIVTGPTAVEIIPGTVGISTNRAPEIMLYPNPVTGKVTLHTNKHDVYDLSISSLNGQLIFSREMEGTSHQLDLSTFKKGVYFITIRSEDFVTTRKIIKL